MRRGGARAAAVAVVLPLGAAACGGGGSGQSAACEAYQQVRASLQAASVDAGPARLSAVERDLAALSEKAGTDALEAAAAKSRAGWTAYRKAAAAVPPDEFTARQRYFEALRPLDAFTSACDEL